MGSNQSTATSRRKPTTSDGFLGRARHTKDYEYHRGVNEITRRAIGRLIIEYCGNEGYHIYLDPVRQTTLRFLRAANSFIPDAEDDGADLSNTAFILRQPGQEFVIQAGNGDWEYDFCEDADGEIYGRCIRMPCRWYLWDKVKQGVVKFGSTVAGFITGPVTKALTWF